MPLAASRRSVLQRVGAFAAFASAATTPGFARAREAQDEEYWELVRRQFIFPETSAPSRASPRWPT